MRTAISAAIVAAVLAVSALAGLISVHRADVRTQNALQAQITQEARTVGALRAQDSAAVAGLRAKSSGASADLITCGDLQVLLNGTPAAGYTGLNTVLAGASSGITMQLPGHCLNR